MRLLDLFSGAGGAARGYRRAGFYVVGIDNRPMPRYAGDEFILGDALEYCTAHGHEFDAIHASPPCQGYSVMTNGRWKDRKHPKLIAQTRSALIETGREYVIENVGGARRELVNPTMLCGTMFGLETKHNIQLWRHRYFELSFAMVFTPPCRHSKGSAIGVYGGGQNPARRRRNTKEKYIDVDFGIIARRQAMGIDWMTGKELNESIPPAYTEYIGRFLLEAIKERV